jgi:antitoxin component of MazEF toxin-antitoxin module
LVSTRAPRFKAGDQVNIEVHAGGTITLTPLRPRPSPADVSKVIKSTMEDYAHTTKKLA